MEGDDCATIVMKSHKAGNQALFNNAAQSWNHEFYWKCMKPGGGGEPTGALMEQIKKDFGSYDEFKKQFETAVSPLARMLPHSRTPSRPLHNA